MKKRLPVYCLLIFLSACSTQQQTVSTTPTLEPNRAQKLLTQAKQVSEPLATQLQLKASRILFSENKYQLSINALNNIKQEQLSSSALIAEFLFLQATTHSYIQAEGTIEWFNALSSEHLSSLNEADQWLWQQRYAIELSKNKQLNEAISLLEHQRPLLAEQEAIKLTNNIWDLIKTTQPTNLSELIESSPNDITREWLTLALIINGAAQDNFKGFALKQWLNSNPNHPAAINQPAEVKELPLPEQAHIKKIALLLPLTGRFASVSKAITQGFLMASYSLEHDQRPEIQVIDSTLNDFSTTYDAITADLIIGPLSRDRVKALSNRTQLKTPTIALNSVNEENKTLNLFYIGLQAEDEAKTLARYALRNNLTTGAVLTYPSKKGLKLATTFKETIEKKEETKPYLKGKISHIQTLEENWATSLKKTLEIDKSNQRAKKISRLINTPIEFTARKRDDLQFIYSPLKYKDLRQANPLMAFYFAKDIQILSNSDITPQLYPNKRDKDLNGIIFTDYKWPINQTNSSLPPKSDPTTRFYSWGADSFDIARNLPILLAMKHHTIKTFSSFAYFNGQNRFIREFPLSYVRHGKAHEKTNRLKIN